jgi:hypothetical protein
MRESSVRPVSRPVRTELFLLTPGCHQAVVPESGTPEGNTFFTVPNRPCRMNYLPEPSGGGGVGWVSIPARVRHGRPPDNLRGNRAGSLPAGAEAPEDFESGDGGSHPARARSGCRAVPRRRHHDNPAAPPRCTPEAGCKRQLPYARIRRAREVKRQELYTRVFSSRILL